MPGVNVLRIAPKLKKDEVVVVNNCGSGYKDKKIYIENIGYYPRMKNPIAVAFKNTNDENRPALISYTVCGDNNKKISLEILKSISKSLDIVEWGVPHNCPTADGKEIQNSSYRALKNGIKLNDVFQMVKKYKKIKTLSL